MNELKTFHDDMFGEIRVLIKDNRPWFVIKDVCAALDLGTTSKTTEILKTYMKAKNIISTNGGPQNMTIVTEKGLRTILKHSKKPYISRFIKWLEESILPQINKGGKQMNDLQVIEHNNQRILTTNQLADYYEATGKMISNNFNNNKERFVENKHYYLLQGQALKDFLHSYNLGLQNISKIRSLYLWTERGALHHAKILDTDKAWQAYEKLEDTYFKVQELKQLDGFSPQLQLLINMEIKQNRLEAAITTTNERIDNIKDVVSLDTTSWRIDTQNLIVKIAYELGGIECIKDLRKESYRLLNTRMGVDIQRRLTNKRRRMADEGAAKSKRDKLNYLDVIAEDKKLIEGYTAIVKEMSIKYGVA